MPPPPPCINCPDSHLGLNGRYCRRHSRYVEHHHHPPCRIGQNNGPIRDGRPGHERPETPDNIRLL